jgi:hypothetical protein
MDSLDLHACLSVAHNTVLKTSTIWCLSVTHMSPYVIGIVLLEPTLHTNGVDAIMHAWQG